MAEQFLTLMADYCAEDQARISVWYDALQQAGFVGTQTPGLNHHISLATFPLDMEEEATALTKRIAAEFAPVEAAVRHVGVMPGGKVLFAAPDMSPALTALQRACAGDRPLNGYPCRLDRVDKLLINRLMRVALSNIQPLFGQRLIVQPVRRVHAFDRDYIICHRYGFGQIESADHRHIRIVSRTI